MIVVFKYALSFSHKTAQSCFKLSAVCVTLLPRFGVFEGPVAIEKSTLMLWINFLGFFFDD